MNKYLISIIIVSIAIGLCNIISPKHKGIEKHIKLVGMLIILSVAISPIVKALDDADFNFLESIKEKISAGTENQDDYNQILKEYLTSFSLAEAKEYIKSDLIEEYDIPEGECEIIIEIDQSENETKIKRISVLLSGYSVFKNPYEIEQYLSQNYECDAQVAIKSKE